MPNEVDMNKLREEAARRAREMQARAHIPPPRKPPKEPPRQEPPPPEPPPPPAPAPAPKGEPGLLDAFFQDKERTIILALLLLLSGDEKNHELLFALLNFVLTSCSSPMGPRAWSFWVEMPISAPRPNWPPSVKRVLALTYTAAASTSLRNRWAAV